MTTSDVTMQTGARLTAHSVAIDGPVDLLDHYTPDGFAWLEGDHGFVTSGVAALVAPTDAGAFLATIRHHSTDDVSESAGPRAVGALPFVGSGELVVPALVVGRDVRGRLWRTVIADADVSEPVAVSLSDEPPSKFRVATTTTRAEWRAMVEHTLAEIERGGVKKVVLARAVEIEADRPFDVAEVLSHLRRSQPGCIIYADRGFVGASPELLARKVGTTVTSRPLAGTGIDTDALAHSVKDANEHQLVVDEVVHGLRTLCSDVFADGPAILELADVSHLATTINARTENANTTITDLVAELHPTPAVGGTPRPIALAAIDELEKVSRGRYAGPCGWIDSHGNGEFVVALRGGEITGNRALIHAGAGIVSGSDPDSEWTETQQKLTPMLQALVRP